MTVSHWNSLLLSSPFTIVLKYKLPQTSLVKSINNLCAHKGTVWHLSKNYIKHHREVLCVTSMLKTSEEKTPKNCFSKQENKMSGCLKCIMWAMSSKNRLGIKLLKEYTLYAENVWCIFYCSKNSLMVGRMCSESGLESTMWGGVEVRGQCIPVTVNQYECVNFFLKE